LLAYEKGHRSSESQNRRFRHHHHHIFVWKKALLRGRQTIDKFGQLLWAWFSLLRKSADEIVELWHTLLATSRQWRQKNGRRTIQMFVGRFYWQTK